ncbi:MAG: TauD/TfdA family dioxygenase [Proteobacteria bacterium]|nr:TauD/TfdA family dioxygenase [Pseudomonadota bacterium]MDA1024005.1 TauD/TfdA family dioxygenase [Pseudomonadota bacterium]
MSADLSIQLPVIPLDNPLSAEVRGLDLSQDLDDQTIQGLHKAWMAYPVLVIRNQELSPERHIEYSRRFGDLQVHSVSEINHPKYPELLVLSNIGRGGSQPINNGGAYWHSDITYEAIPPMGSILHGIVTPKEGGDTLYADMTRAYDALDEDTKQEIEGLTAVHTYRTRYEAMMHEGVRPPKTEEELSQWVDVTHPIARTHPETGKKAIYVNEGFTQRVNGLGDNAGRALLEKLFAHSTQEQFVYRHKWHQGDVVMWDNRCTIHRATDYDLSQERSMHRTTVRGTKPV